jgi:hypothetical protein
MQYPHKIPLGNQLTQLSVVESKNPVEQEVHFTAVLSQVAQF